MNVELMNQIERADGANAKIKLLKLADERTRKWVRFSADPFMTFGMTAGHRQGFEPELDKQDAALFGATALDRAMANVRDMNADNLWWNEGETMLGALAKRKLTGNAARNAVHSWLDRAPSQDHAKWGARVINKDLRCGLGETNILKALPGLFETFKVQLAHPLDPETHKNDLVPGLVQPKIDGLRMLVIKGQALTREGHPMQNVGHIIAQLRKLQPDLDDWVWDGECVNPDVPFEQTLSAARGKAVQSGLVFYAFDLIDRESWEAKDTLSTLDRYRELATFRGSDAVRIVPSTFLARPTLDQLMEYRDGYIAQGFEGAMYKPGDRSYEWKRSDAALKIKAWHTHDVTIIGYYEGEKGITGMLGGFTVQDELGQRFDCGTGFSHRERQVFWELREQMLGKMIEVRYQNKTHNAKDRHPVFMRVRTDKTR